MEREILLQIVEILEESPGVVEELKSLAAGVPMSRIAGLGRTRPFCMLWIYRSNISFVREGVCRVLARAVTDAPRVVDGDPRGDEFGVQ